MRILVRRVLFLAIPLALGCHQPSDSELFRSAVEEVQAGDAVEIDARDHPRVDDADLAGLAGAIHLENLCLDGASVGASIAWPFPTLAWKRWPSCPN